MSAHRQQRRVSRARTDVVEHAAAAAVVVQRGGTGTVGVTDALCNQRDRARGVRNSQS